MVLNWLLKTRSFSLHMTLIDELESSELLDFCDVFIRCLDSFWWHPFTAGKVLQNGSNEETSLSTIWMA